MTPGVLWPDGANCKVLYHLENANDSSGNGKTLTNNGASFATGILNVGADLGTSGTYYLDRVTDDVIDTAGNLTFLIWIKFTTLPTTGTWVLIARLAKSGSPVHDIWLVNIGGNQTLEYYVDAAHIDKAITITTGKKHCIGITYTASGAVKKLYYNGVAIA